MVFFLVATALALHIALWGAGLAVLAMPRPWHRFWPVLILPAGLALQSAAVWVGALSGLRGTETYAWASFILPVGLLLAASRRKRFSEARADLARFAAVWAVATVTLIFLLLPLAVGLRGLTTISLGSCDAADYAAGARVFMEFGRGSREGFLGLTEVVQVQSADNFFDYWIRLNHFTPAALMALNGTILNCAPHELATILTVMVLVCSVPLVFWIARSVLALRGPSSVLVALLYGMSPVTWYAVGQVAPSQLLAAMAIALITWAAISAWRLRRRGKAAWRLGGVLAIGYWLVLGSYNFILIACLVPATAYVGVMALRRRELSAVGRWTCVVLAPLAVCAVLFLGRVVGLVERFTLLRSYDFGWRIPLLTPEGWLGFVGVAPSLAGMALFWRIALSVLLFAAVVIAFRQR
ncbi:MAG: hypothetical protein Q7S40_04775, partial [Opitutaceae bacterium]|nr:hypothetical protein [Opitutaceae bacterium]